MILLKALLFSLLFLNDITRISRGRGGGSSCVDAFSNNQNNVYEISYTHRPNEELRNVVIFGGSGYIGRRICQQLVESNQCNKIISVSKHGKPPSYYLSDDDDDGSSWSNQVTWLRYDLEKAISDSSSENDRDTMREQLIDQILQT